MGIKKSKEIKLNVSILIIDFNPPLILTILTIKSRQALIFHVLYGINHKSIVFDVVDARCLQSKLALFLQLFSSAEYNI